jgi:ElaB/YqjD/DUF883 family membrane-anchored ribosome-binding protein
LANVNQPKLKSAQKTVGERCSTLNTREWVFMMSGDYSQIHGRGFFMDAETGNKEKVVSDLRVLVADAEELLKATANQAGEKIAVARQKIEQSLVEGKKALADAEKTLVKKSKECAEIADDYVRENPWSAVGIAASAGLVIGLLIRGR